MQKYRENISLLFLKFFQHPTIATAIGAPKDYTVIANFDVNVLKEPRQLLEEVAFLYEHAIIDQPTAAQELGRDPERLKASKAQTRQENDDNGIWEPIGTQGQAISPTGPNGRPANPGVERSEQTRTRSPGGQVTENA
jgi:hypothetical protein